MAMSPNVGDRELHKFEEDANGDTTVRVTVAQTKDGDGDKQKINEDGSALIASADIEQTLSGMLTYLKIIAYQLSVVTGEVVSIDETVGGDNE